MQIYEVTQKSGGFGSAIGDELETLAFGSPTTKYDELEPKTKPSLELMKKATASLQGGPALTAQELKQVNDYRVSNGEKPITAANLAAAANQPPLATSSTAQSPEQIRKAKQAITAKAAQDQMAGKPPVANQPAAAAPSAAVTPVDPTVPPKPYYLNGRQLDPSNPSDAYYIKQLQAQGVTSGTRKT